MLSPRQRGCLVMRTQVSIRKQLAVSSNDEERVSAAQMWVKAPRTAFGNILFTTKQKTLSHAPPREVGHRGTISHGIAARMIESCLR